jgi:hypothetical protein
MKKAHQHDFDIKVVFSLSDCCFVSGSYLRTQVSYFITVIFQQIEPNSFAEAFAQISFLIFDK